MPPIILPRSEHSVSRRNIDPDALKVLYRLKSAGHVAYLVGGSVRDLLLGRRPKDFDISTSALPNEVRRLFRNCRLIGRRFRLAHIVFGRDKVIEVATFRRKSEEEPSAEGDLLVRRDNTFGGPEEDAERRDFTANGLFYDIASFSIIDWVGGLRDLEERTIRTIGDPAVRYREDPVRMLRAVKFAARLEFHIANEDLEAIREFRGDLLRTSPERLRLELGRLLSAGYASRSVGLLQDTGLLEIVSPELVAHLDAQRALDPQASARTLADLVGLDHLVSRRHLQGRLDELPQPVLMGALLSPVVLGASPPPRPPLVLELRGIGFAAGLVPWPEPPSAVTESDSEAEPIPGEPIEQPAEGAAQDQTRTGVALEEGPEPIAAADDSGPVEEAAALLAAPPIDAALEEDREGEEALQPESDEELAPHLVPELPVFADSDPAAGVEQRIAGFLLRFAVPRRDAERLVQILAAQRRLRNPGRREAAYRQLVRKDYYPDALQLFEAHVLGTGVGRRELGLWQAQESAGRSAAGAERGEGGARGRRRRRGRRRGGRGATEGPAGYERSAPVPDDERLPDAEEPVAASADLSEEEENRLRQKAEADQMRREQAFQPGRYLPAAHTSGLRGYDAPGRPRVDPKSPLGSAIDVSDERGGFRRRRRRQRGGRGPQRGGGSGHGPATS